MRRWLFAVVGCAFVSATACVNGGADEESAPTDSAPSDSETGASDDTLAADDGLPGDAVFEAEPLLDAVTSEGGPAMCKGLGTYCGSRLGLDPTKLYSCNDSKIVGVARTCSGPCIEVTGSDSDLCPCPNGDGRYCGARVGEDANHLYDCKSGKLTEVAQCAGKCNAGSSATSDACAACASGNGAYCGSTVEGDPNKVYQCEGGVVTVKSNCGAACVVEKPGVADHCPVCPSGDGAYCGGPVGLDPNTLYTCKSGVYTVTEKCGSTCHVAPPGTPDYCESSGSGLLCSNVQWWNVGITYGPYMSYGWWDTDLAVSNMTKVQLRHDSKLDKEGVYGWGWMPEFTDQVTGQRFRFLHLQPTAKYTTTIGKVYPAGTIVGLSGGASAETGYPTYSTGAHLCVQTLAAYRDAFPAGKDGCH